MRKLACAAQKQQQQSIQQTKADRLFCFISQMLKLQFISICKRHIMTYRVLIFVVVVFFSFFFVISLIRNCVLFKYAVTLSAFASLLCIDSFVHVPHPYFSDCCCCCRCRFFYSTFISVLCFLYISVLYEYTY